MKFCTKCGHELVDDAVICLACGCMVGGANAPKKAETSTESPEGTPSESSGKLPAVFNFVFTLATMVSGFFLVLSLAFPYAEVWLDAVYVYPQIDLAILAWLCSFVSLGFGVASFSVTLAKRLGTEKMLGAIARFIMGVMLSLLCFIVIGAAA